MTSDSMGTQTLIAGMFLTGCANSLLTKYQDKLCVENCDGKGQRLDFEQPVWQTLNMFVGEFLCVLPLLWGRFTSQPKIVLPEGELPIPVEAEGERVPLRGWACFWLWFPAFCDICGTTLMNVGLILTPVSVYQMSRGALVLWVGVLSVIFLRRHLALYQWASLIIVTLGVALVGLAGTLAKRGGVTPETLMDIVASTRADDEPAKVALGVILILFAQIFTASQYVVEEKIMAHYAVDALAAVSLEGTFGGLTTAAAMPVLHYFFAKKNAYFDVPRGWAQIINNPPVMWASFMIALSIGAFNFFGLSVTSRVSATTRSTIDTCRTLGIWIVSVAIGWEALSIYSILQVAGFAMLVYGTFVFNGLLRPVICKPRIELEDDEEA